MDDMDDSLRKEQELEAQMQALQEQLDAVRAANRDAAVADVKAKIKRYAITRTELATAFPVLRRSSNTVLDASGGAVQTKKRRGRPRKVKTENVTE